MHGANIDEFSGGNGGKWKVRRLGRSSRNGEQTKDKVAKEMMQ